MKPKRGVAILVSAAAGAAVVALIWGICWFEESVTDQFIILTAKRPWPTGTAFLAEADTLRIAGDAMNAAGYPTDSWRPQKDDRSKAPDGRPDEYLVRNTIDPNSGWIMYQNPSREDWYRDLFVKFEKKDDQLYVVVHRGK
jgi:hypothetical protein